MISGSIRVDQAIAEPCNLMRSKVSLSSVLKWLNYLLFGRRNRRFLGECLVFNLNNFLLKESNICWVYLNQQLSVIR